MAVSASSLARARKDPGYSLLAALDQNDPNPEDFRHFSVFMAVPPGAISSAIFGDFMVKRQAWSIGRPVAPSSGRNAPG